MPVLHLFNIQPFIPTTIFRADVIWQNPSFALSGFHYWRKTHSDPYRYYFICQYRADIIGLPWKKTHILLSNNDHVFSLTFIFDIPTNITFSTLTLKVNQVWFWSIWFPQIQKELNFTPRTSQVQGSCFGAKDFPQHFLHVNTICYRLLLWTRYIPSRRKWYCQIQESRLWARLNLRR